MNKKTKCYVFPMMFAVIFTCIGCIGTDNSENTENSTGDSEKYNTGKFSYDEDFTLVGNIVKEYGAFGSVRFVMENGSESINLPDGERYYQIQVTTYDPESKVKVSSNYTYNYEYKADKFSNFSSASSIGHDDIGNVDKMKNLNKSIRIVPLSESSASAIIEHFEQPDALETKLISRNNFSIELKIPDRLFLSSDGVKEGDIIKSNGHITIKEIEKDEAGTGYYNLTKIG